jgi:hypothetical protein
VGGALQGAADVGGACVEVEIVLSQADEFALTQAGVQGEVIQRLQATTSVTVAPASTARTARYLCSTTDNSTSANPGLPTRAATTRTEKPITATVNHQLGPKCQASPATGHSASGWAVQSFFT